MKYKFYIIFSILFIPIILFKGYVFSLKYISDDVEKEYTVFVQSLKTRSDTKVSYNVKLLGTSNKFILNIYDNSYDNVETHLSKLANYTYGDVIKFKGKISIPQKLNNPGEFNYKLYLYSNNIYGLINTYEVPKKVDYSLNFSEKIWLKIYQFKQHAEEIIKSSMQELNANVAISIIYGDMVDLDKEVKENFEDVGVSHLMSVSGTHITSFMIIINMFLSFNKQQDNKKKMNKKENVKSKIIGIIQIFAILIYMLFTGLSLSVLRAGIMLIISIVCDMVSIKKNKYVALVLTLSIILFNNPFAIFNVGMQLSFLATLGIIMFGSKLVNSMYRLTNKIKNSILDKIVKYIINNISITVAVQLFIIPIEIQSFNKIPFPIIIPNLILGLISAPIRIVGTLGIMLVFIPSISRKIFSILELVVIVLLKATNIFKYISFNVSTASMPIVFFAIYYICIIGIFIYMKLKNISRNNVHFKTKYNFKRLSKYIKILNISLTIVLIAIVIFVNVYSKYLSEYVYFFNVEQGDMSYIKCGENSVIVDIGSMRQNLAFNTISNYFKQYNLDKVDAVVISHFHSDHMNGLPNLIKLYNVKMVIYAKPKTINETYVNFINLLDKYNIVKKEVKAGDVITVGKITIKVLLPGNEYIESKDEENANSLVCEIKVKGKSLLYMGDALKETEEKLLDSNVNIEKIYILKVGHHGSKTSTGNEFVKKISPQNAVISCLEKYYGHPHENTINTLKRNNAWIYLTQKQGAIKFKLN